ncbi:DUF4251 domain-containing protein [Persicobacter psychrovividus]|uniref:DUF4251 domain-containing protein n=1 Tax=Persicobacter psychrovividus TaxID=387638 RepID=A0ABN6LEH9_9BACT|nr:hypothetical protein PEPS_38660 [Persicobacter psychrovividus]
MNKLTTIWMIIFVMIANVAFAQGTITTEQTDQPLTKKEQRRLAKQQKKIAEAEQEAIQAEITKQMIESGAFVLESHTLYNKYGRTAMVNSNTNFISIAQEEGVMQLAFQNIPVGINGIGGVTWEGKVNKYEFKENKHGGYMVSFSLFGSAGNFDVTMTVMASGQATARIRGNWSSELKYQGDLVPVNKSRVYKGFSRF